MANQSPPPGFARGFLREALGALLVFTSVVGAAWLGSLVIGWPAWGLLGCLVLAAIGLGLLLRSLEPSGNGAETGAETGRLVVVDPDDPDALIPGR